MTLSPAPFWSRVSALIRVPGDLCLRATSLRLVVSVDAALQVLALLKTSSIPSHPQLQHFSVTGKNPFNTQ